MTTISNQFLEKIIENKSCASIYLINGIKLQGVIERHDDTAMYLVNVNSNQIVFKHAISTILV